MVSWLSAWEKNPQMEPVQVFYLLKKERSVQINTYY